MKIYGVPLLMGGSSGKNDTLPPLLYNFTAERVNGSDGTATITLSADRMPESLAGELAGAVWVYGEHEPKNINDGTRLELARDEIVKPDAVTTYSARKTVADLPSKSKVKLGRYGDADLQWLVSRNAENKLILVLDSNSISALGSKILDAAEPSNGASDRQKYGNNRYIYTNLHQWLNAEKGANQWFVKAHNADIQPPYSNQAGFLNGWTKEELGLLELVEWTVTKSSTDGSGTETFRSRVVLPSITEMGFSSNTGGSKLDIFNSDSDRKTGMSYWTRTPYPSSPCINYQVKSDGTLYSGGYGSYNGTVRPICAIPASTLVSDTTDSDGCYTIQFVPPAQKTFAWHIYKDLYARQFTYNSKKQYQTMLSGAIAYSPIKPSQIPISLLPSKSMVKLGSYNGTPLKWIVCRDSVDQSMRLLLDADSVKALGARQFDAKEPKSNIEVVQSYGNAFYCFSNIHQWLNSAKNAGQWYTAQHSADAPPDYQNESGFLNGWSEKDISALESPEWEIRRASQLGGSLFRFYARIVLVSATEAAKKTNTADGNRLDIFEKASDARISVAYTTRSLCEDSVWNTECIHTDDSTAPGPTPNESQYVRPLCQPNPDTLVSLPPDSDGCYTIV